MKFKDLKIGAWFVTADEDAVFDRIQAYEKKSSQSAYYLDPNEKGELTTEGGVTRRLTRRLHPSSRVYGLSK